MRSIFAIAVATATASTINAIVLPPTDQRPAAAELPEGFFYGYNNPDGTSTLHFPDTRENITFNPTPAPLPCRPHKAPKWPDNIRLLVRHPG
jgi:hypothetical protein